MNPIELERITTPDGKLYGVSWNDSDGLPYVRRIGGFGVERRSGGQARPRARERRWPPRHRRGRGELLPVLRPEPGFRGSYACCGRFLPFDARTPSRDASLRNFA